MILDYEYSRDKKQFSISFIKPDGNKEVMHFDNIQKFLTYYYTPEGRFNTWNEAKCDTKYTYNPSKFDIKEFIYNLAPEIQEKLDGKTFPKLYTFDIETRLKSGPHGEIGLGDFTDPTVADEPIHCISLVSPNLNSVVMGDKPLSEKQIQWVADQFYAYLDSIPFYRTLGIPKPQFKYVYFDSEERMIRFFLENVIAKVPILAGWNSIGYDWCYITSRIKNFYPNLSVAMGSHTHTVNYSNYTNIKGETIKLPYPTHTLILDMMDIIDKEDTQVLPTKESMNLDYISGEALGANKVEYDGNLEELYINDFPRYVFYNLIDSILVQLNDKKFKTMDHIYMYSLYAKERIGQCFSKIALTESLILKHFRSTNTKIVWEPKEQVERGRLVGAYVKMPVAGLWELVCCNDFSGLYPTTGIVTNISFDNFVGTFYDEEKLAPYRRDPENYIVVCASVYKNKGTLAKPKLGDFIVQYLDEEKLAPYRADKNYFVSINGHVYKNDKDYTLKQVWNNLRLERKYSKYLSKKLDAHISNDIAHILRCYSENGNLDKLHHDVLNTYTDDEITKLKEMGYNFTCGEDLVGLSEADLKELSRIIKEEITYLSNLEQAIKLMMNSIYGGTSHQAFYWFNIALANDVTGEGRNLTHHMERHLNEFWRDAWQTNPELKKIQDELGIKLKPKEVIDQILANSHDNSLVTCVYGDTDSLYLSYKDLIDTIEGSESMTLDEKLKIILKINTEFLDKHNKEHIRDYFLSRNVRPNTADLEDFELETVNKRGVWLHETKKRYGQILLWKEGKFYDIDDLPIKVKGLEVIKSSYPTIARKQLKQMLRFLLEYDGKYLTQELNLMSQKFLKEFEEADVDMISGNLRVNGYLQKVVQDTDPNGFTTVPKAPFNVKALAMYNWLNNIHHLGSEPIYGGKLKYYTMKGSSEKNGDIYFAYEGTKHPKWAEKYAPIDPRRMYQKFVLDPINRILSSASMPLLRADGSIQLDLF
jgi:DNA polymerase elongation subunit (family B)